MYAGNAGQSEFKLFVRSDVTFVGGEFFAEGI
jgi:hypothetical protein